MLIIGCDFHFGFLQVAIFDNRTGELQERRLPHREEAEQFYRSLSGAVRVGMEACGHYPWFERLLQELGFELWLGDAAEVRGLGGAQAENGSAGRGALTASAAGKSVSEDLGAEPGSARWAAIAGASSQAGAGPDADQEPAAGQCVEPGSAEKMEVVDETGTRRTGAVASVAVRSRAAPAVAGNAGRAGSGSGRVEPAGGGRSPKAAGGDAAADPSGSRSGDGVGHGADAGAGGALRLRQKRGGQLLR